MGLTIRQADPKHQPGAYVRDGNELMMILEPVTDGFLIEDALSGYQRALSTAELDACVLVREGPTR